MHILLARKQIILSFTLALSTLFFTSLSLSYNPGLNYLPVRDDGSTESINESEQGCVYRESEAAGGDWTVDDCDYVGAHYACYNGSQWQVAQALGAITDPGEPLDGIVASNIKSVDLWDPVKADNLCKSYFGPSYFFSVPINAEEDEKLGAAITKIIASKKRTWLYYYSNTNNISLSANYWLGNRTEYTNVLNSNLGNAGELGGGTADCTFINRDTGLWQDAPCSEQHAFACYDSGTWLITATQESWKSGFSTCETEYGQQTLYAVPRDASENNAIATAALPSGTSGLAENYNKVWLNRSDLAYEEFFISNQTRQAWWGVGQPNNRGNADCTLVDSTGNWIAESCNGYVAYHACYLGNNQWQLTSDLADLKRSESALGFGLCKRLSDNAEYRPPNTAVSNSALAVEINKLPEDKFVWINYSDQASEGYWKVENPFLDFVSIDGILAGDDQDCGYFSLATDNKKNWLAGQCYAGGASLEQGFACTNGYEWKIATEALVDNSSLLSSLWKNGFTACEAAFGKDFEFAAPYDADQNSRLALALRLSGNTQAWMNINDAKAEGIWIANGPVVNLSPVISLSTEREFPEKESINLFVSALDPETGSNEGLTYEWSIIGDSVGDDGAGTDTVIKPTLINSNTPNVTITATDLLNDNYYLDVQLQVTDADDVSPATTTTVIRIKIVSPLVAAYDFNNYTNPALDVSGNGHNLTINVSEVEITANNNGLNDYFAKMDAADSFYIDGSISGLQLDSAADQYTLIYRFRMDSDSTSDWAGFVQKGDSGSRQPAIFYNKALNKIHFTNSTTSSWNEASDSLESVRLGQWMTVAYVKNGRNLNLYIDKAELNAIEPDPVPLNVIPDSSTVLLGDGINYESGNWVFGNVPDAAEGIVGGFDDIRIYDRALTSEELNTIFPEQPKGIFEFVNQQETGEENETNGSVQEILIPVKRVSGDDGIVSVGYRLISDSALLDTDFRLKNDAEIIGSSMRGQGVLTWQVHDNSNKNILVELIGDSLREGTESFTIELEELAAEPSLGTGSIISVNIVDKTPNPYGAISIAPTTETENIAVDEGDSGEVTIERVGTDSLGAFDIIYEIEALTASSPDDFSITQVGFPITGTSNGSVLGQGRLSFPANESGTPIDKQLQTISFTTVHPDAVEFDELFSVTLLDITDPGSPSLTDPVTSAILGTKRGYTQVINDITPGRVSFTQATYFGDEIDQGDGSNVVVISLQRLAGDDGSMCIELETSGSTADASDYSISYLNPSASGQSDIYWADKDTENKSVQITINNDQKYDPSETLELTWVRKPNCNSNETVIPNVDVSDNLSATLSIIDHTTPIKLKFTEANYSVSELTATKIITIQATQSRQAGNATLGDFNSRTNNNTFSVFLNRASGGTALEGTHFGDLSSFEVLTFGPNETEKTIAVPIVDNCDAADSLSFEMGLLNDHTSLSNTLPVSLLDVSDAGSSMTIINGSNPINFTNIMPDYTGVANRIIPTWKGDEKLYVTGNISNADRNPEMTEMRLKANVNHNCLNDVNPIVFNWSYANSSPSLPTGNGLPAGFSMAPVITASPDKTLLDKFTLPFVLRNTDLTVSLTLVDNEIGVTYNAASLGYEGLDYSFTVNPYFRIIQNNGEGGNNCVDWEGVDKRLLSKGCGTMDRQNGLAYNPNTQQLVFGEYSGLTGPVCVSHAGGDDWLYGKYCGAAADLGQRWSVTTNRVNSLDRSGIFFMESGIGTGQEPFARTDSTSYTNGAKNWTWLDRGGYLPN